MKNMKKRILAALLSLSMIASVVSPAGPVMNVSAATELVNVALGGTAYTDNTSGDNTVISNVNDGKDATVWTCAGEWPTTAVVKLDQGRSISKVVVKLGGDDRASRSVDVTVQYAQNGVTGDLLPVGSKQDVTLSGASRNVTFDLDTPISATHFYVTLSDPVQNGATGTFWGCISEIEVYESQEVTLSQYNNISGQAIVGTNGNKGTTDAGKLIDKDDSTVYGFHGKLEDDRYVTLQFEEARSIDAVRIAFEHIGSTDGSNYQYTYSIHARNGNGDYSPIVENEKANRTDLWEQSYKFAETTYSEVKITMHGASCSSNLERDQYKIWPGIAEFEIYGSESEVTDSDSIAFRQPVRAASGKSTASNVTDGNVNTKWTGDYYPAYVDIDLEKNYNLDTVEIFTPENGYSQYSIYTSLNGRDFSKLAEKTTKNSASLATGEVYQANKKEARIIRVYMEYNSVQVAPVLNEVRVTGTESGTALQETPAINVVEYINSDYAKKTIEADDTYAEVYGIIKRRLGEEYQDWFTLGLAESESGYDYFELSNNEDGTVHVKGNDGVSLATGINHFLKYYCNVNISQVGDQVTMPTAIPVINGTVHKETKAKVRYSYNYCTLSYSMAFWGEKEWRDELDWLALNGVNVVLDATAQEEVWRRFLGELGYSHADAKDYIAGPAYYAWAYMANLSGFGGPVHDSWFEERTELARKNQQIMRTLGMQPVLQGYSGMVPTDIVSKATGTYALTSSDIISQGKWCSFQRPAMLKTTNAAFDKYAELFYACQKDVYGDVSDYYATDPFHEGGNTGNMNATDIAREVLTSMLTADKDAIWIIQSWQGNPTTALLNGLDEVTNGAQHALVLDLYAEKTPHHGQVNASDGAGEPSYGDTDEFDDTPWLFCMLNNFGGRLGLHGHLDNLANNIPAAFNNTNNKHIAGIGITPEASVNNPVLYDFLFETIWQDDATQNLPTIKLDTWLDSYATRRYGAESANANAAWDILKETVYKASLNNIKQGAPECVVNARPALTINAASTWGNAIISYDKLLLEDAAELLLKDYKTLESSEGYMYDVANVLQQVLSNSAQEYHNRMTAAYNAKDVEDFKAQSAKFLEIIDYMERVTATSEYFLLGRWVEQAKALAKNADDFTRELYEFNARALITTWGSYNQAENGGLKDYSNRQWSGLISDFYKPRWERWITARTNELEGKSYETSINWFQWEWEWVRNNKTRSNEVAYSVTPTIEDFSVLGAEILQKYTSENPAEDASRDVPVTNMTVEAGDYETDGNDKEGTPDFVKDGKEDTLWHTEWHPTTTSRDKHYLIFNFSTPTVIDGMRFLQRQSGTNGLITKFDLYVKRAPQSEVAMIAEDGAGDWELLIDDGILSTNISWQMVNIPETKVTAVKFQSVDSKSSNDNVFAAAAEIRFTTPAQADVTPEKVVDINLKVGETATIKDLLGVYTEAGLEKLDSTKATVAVKDITVSDVAAYTYDTGTGKYENTAIEFSDCLYTFTLNEDGSSYTVSALAEDGTTVVYLNPRHENHGFPSRTTKDSIIVEKQADGGFKLKDGTQTDYYLTFWYQWYVFNETKSNETKATTVFQLYERKENVDANGNITYSYQAVDMVENGKQYAIVAEFTNNNVEEKYAVRPSSAYSNGDQITERNEHVVRLSEERTTATAKELTIKGISQGTTSIMVGTTQYNIMVEGEEKEVTVRVGETVRLFDKSGNFAANGLDSLDKTIADVVVTPMTMKEKAAALRLDKQDIPGKTVPLSSCIYSFNENVDGSYTITGTTEDGTLVYVNPHTNGQKGYPNSTKVENIKIEKNTDGTNTFKLIDASDDKYCLTYRGDWAIFNEVDIDQSTSIQYFKLYELKETTPGVYEYQEVSEAADGGLYVIAAQYGSEEFALRPSAKVENGESAVERDDHVVRITDTIAEETGNEILIEGMKVGDTVITVGSTRYTIHVIGGVQRLKLEVKEEIVLPGRKVTQHPDDTIVSMEKVEGGYKITGVDAGETAVVIDETTYYLLVKETQVAAGIGIGTGKEVTRLTLSANNTFNLDIINSESNAVEWRVENPDGTVANWATITKDGEVSAVKKDEHKKTHDGYIVAVVDGTIYKIEFKLSPAPTSSSIRLYNLYIDELYHTELYYGWIYGYGTTDTPEYDSTDLVKAIKGEAIYVSMGYDYANGLDFFAKPEEGYALTKMGATNSAGDYMRLQGDTLEEMEFIKTEGVAGNGQYYEIDEEATANLINQAIKFGCDGAHGFTRLANAPNNIDSSLSYRSEKLPTVEKTVCGIGTGNDYRVYSKGASAKVGEYVFFKVTVDTYPILGTYVDDEGNEVSDKKVVEYLAVGLKDMLNGAVFIPKDKVGEVNPISEGDSDEKDILQDILGEELVGQTHEYYVAYQLKAEDITSVDYELSNTVKLTTNYKTHYSSGDYSGSASGNAKILITTEPREERLVVDYGLPVEYKFETAYKLSEEVAKTKYGSVKVTSTPRAENSTIYDNIVVYTPEKMLQGVDEIPLVPVGSGAVETMEVYPATTVYYEEGFATYSEKDGSSQWSGDISLGTGVQEPQVLPTEENKASLTIDPEATVHYGYDKKYAAENAGPSNGTEAVSRVYGSLATFTFTGTAADVYANCQNKDNPTGTLSILVKNGTKIEKLVMVNTQVGGMNNLPSSAQNSIAEAWNLPVASLNMEEHGTYTVSIRHAKTKAESDAEAAGNAVCYPVRLDGFRVYNTLEDQSDFAVHNEANPNFLEMRNAVLGAVDLSKALPETLPKLEKDEQGNIIYPEDLSIYASAYIEGLTQIYEKDAAEATVTGKEKAKAYIVMNDQTTSNQLNASSAKDLLENGPKNEVFLHHGESLIFGLAEGLKNVQVGLKAVDGTLSATDEDAVTIEKTVRNTAIIPETVLEAELVAIDSAILASKAKSNSEQNPAVRDDGPASYAFSEEINWWHSRYDNNGKADHEVSSGKPADNPIWIQTGFGESLTIGQVTYQARNSKQGVIKDYKISVANLADANAEPKDEDFKEIKSGTLECTTDVQTIKFDKEEATHIRITVNSVYSGWSANDEDLGNGYVQAQNIKVYKVEIWEKVYSKYIPDFNAAQPIADGSYILIGANPANAYGRVITRSNNLTETWPLKHSDETKTYVEDGSADLIEKDCTNHEWKFASTANGTSVSFTMLDNTEKYLSVSDSGIQLVDDATTVDVVSNGDSRYAGKGAVSIGTNTEDQYLNYRGGGTVQIWDGQNDGGNGWYLYAAKYALKNAKIEAAIAGVTSQEDYTTKTWSIYKTALDEARKIFDTKKAAVDAYDRLVAAVALLTLKSAEATTENLDLKELKTSTDMFYLLGDTGVAEEGFKEVTTITITNNSDKVLSVTKLKYFAENPAAASEPFVALEREHFMAAMLSMGFDTDAEKQPEETRRPVTEIFSDVKDSWYTSAVQFVYDNGYMNGMSGTDRFEPGTKITKAQVAQILYNMENRPEETDRKVFAELKDVPEDKWYSDAVAWAYNTGVVTGDTASKKFNPNAAVTREQLAVMMYRYAQYKQYDTDQTSDLAGLENTEKVAKWAVDGMKWAVGAGLISGVENAGVKDLAPKASASRAQMAVILQRFCDTYK